MAHRGIQKNLAILGLDKEAAEVARIADGLKILDVYRGDHGGYVDVSDFELFKKNVFRKIIDKKVGVLYQSEPTRALKGVGEAVVFEANILPVLTVMMRKIMRGIELFGKVYVDWKNGEMFTPMEVFTAQDGRIMTLKRNQDAKRTFQWVYDSNVVYVFLNKRLHGRKVSSGLDSYEKEDSDFQRVVELADMQLEVTKIGTFLKIAGVLQGVDQLFTDDNELKTINMSPEVVNFKSKDAKLDVVHFKADLMEIRATWLEMQASVYEISGVPRVSVVGDVSSRSARELMAKWHPLVETYRTLAHEYAMVERAVVGDMLLRLYDVSMEGGRYTVVYDRDFLPTLKRDRLDAMFELANNIITLKTLIREENPVLTDVEIDSLQTANIAENLINKPILTEGAGVGARASD